MNVRPTRVAPPPPTATAERVEEAQFTEAAQHAPPAVRETTNANPMAFSQAETPKAELPVTPFGKLAAAIAGVMAELKPVEKSGWNDFHKYKYAKMGDLSIELTPLMGKHGIVVFQNEIDRAMFDDGRVISVRYEFTIVHSSGEIWPERPIITGMSRCRDSKGGFDDKSFNKAHTAARKYFLLSLFQIPTEDEEDADAERRREERAELGRPAGQRPQRRAPSPDGKVAPHLIAIINGEAPAAWADRFIAAINKATSTNEINQWYDLNASVFDKLKKAEGGAALFDRLVSAMDDREVIVLGGALPNGNGQHKAAPPPAEEEEHWLSALENALSGCEDAMSIAEEQERLMMPMKGKVPAAEWKKALELVETNLKRVTG
jgi:hypothetical protein